MRILIVLCVLFLTSSVYSQTLTGASTDHVSSFELTKARYKKPNMLPSSALEQAELKYFDQSLPTISWVGEGIYGPYLLYWMGERMTLPSQSGFLDSVSIQIDSISTDSLFVLIVEDTLYDVGGGQQFRLINIFREETIIATANIYPEQVSLNSPVMIRFPHIPVPKEFFVVISSSVNQNGQPTNYFFIRGDSKPPHELTTEVARSAGVFIDLQSGTSISAILDGTFVPNGQTEAAFTDFYITAYVDASSTSVENPITNTSKITVIPNPSSDHINVSTPFSEGTVHIYDVLGRIVSTTRIDNVNTQIYLRDIPNGTYSLIVGSGNTVSRTSISVVK
jgi:hypothetical protein